MKSDSFFFRADSPCSGMAPSLLSVVSDMARPQMPCMTPVPLERHLAQAGADICHLPGSADIWLHTAGFYEISYFALVMSPESREAAALLSLDGQMIPGTYCEDHLCPDHASGVLSATTIIQIDAPALLQLYNVSENTIYSSTAVCVRHC